MRRLMSMLAVVTLVVSACSSVDEDEHQATETTTEESADPTSADDTTADDPTNTDPTGEGEPTGDNSGMVEHTDKDGNYSISVPETWIDVIDEAVNVPNTVLAFADEERTLSVIVRALTPWNMVPAPEDIRDQLTSSIGTENVEFVGEEEVAGHETWKFIVTAPQFSTIIYYMNINGRAIEITGNQYGDNGSDQLEEIMSTVKEAS